MTEKKSVEDGILSVSKKLEEIEERLDIMHDSIREMNSAIDMLVRFCMTAKAFMELSITQGLIDPHELNRLASQYEETYSSNLNIPDRPVELDPSKRTFH